MKQRFQRAILPEAFHHRRPVVRCAGGASALVESSLITRAMVNSNRPCQSTGLEPVLVISRHGG